MARKNDEVKARQRFVDQPGQWVDTTPISVKKRQAKAWQEFNAMMEKKPAAKKPATRAKTK